MFTNIKIAGYLVAAGVVISAVFYVRHLQNKVDGLIEEKTQLELLVESKNVEIEKILSNQQLVLQRLQKAEKVISYLDTEKKKRDNDLMELKTRLEKFEFETKPKETVETFLMDFYNKRIECLETLTCEE